MSVALLLLQIAVVVAAARTLGWLGRRFLGQPQVVGEMTAGILLGPSLLGWAAPALSRTLFPPGAIGGLESLSQIGVVLFIFLVGLELDPRLLRDRGRTALLTSHVSIAAPFFLGSLLALHLYPRLSDDSVRFDQFALFLGAAMSVTAFPVLARILAERGLVRTPLGAVSLACAAVDDVTAWCILAGVVALARADAGENALLATVGGSAAYVACMFAVVRPALRRLDAFYRNRGRLTQDLLAAVLLALVVSAWTTEWIGIHALFGAFLLGALLPRESGLAHAVAERLQDVTVVLLLPLFFALTGLRTELGLVSGAGMWLDCGLIVAAAVVGKLGGSALAARVSGLGWRESGALGALMNTRGLMELVFLTIGLEIGVISPALFGMMVVMALLTTFMTTPLLEWMLPSRQARQRALVEAVDEKHFAVVVPVSLPSSGPELLRLAAALAPAPGDRIYGLHLARASDASMLAPRAPGPPEEEETLAPLLAAADARGVTVHPLCFLSPNVGRDVAEVARAKGADLVLMGWHKPVLRESVLSGTVYTVMREAPCDVAVYVPRHFAAWRRVLVSDLGSAHDAAALALAERLATQVGAQVTRLRVGEGSASHASPVEAVVAAASRGVDLVVVGVSEALGVKPTFFGAGHERLARECPASLLIVRASPSREP